MRNSQLTNVAGVSIADCLNGGVSSHRTVAKLFVLEPLGLALSEKQMPQIIETIRSVEN